jgi:transcriptional regulator with XRE-family HTH domain
MSVPVVALDVLDEKTVGAIARALGEELRRTREARGWSRAQFCRRLPSKIGDRTVLAYEHGLRQLTMLRLIELCEALEVDPATVVALGLQRARLHLERLTLHVDLNKMVRDELVRFRPLRQWARNRLNECPDGIAKVDASGVRELTAFVGCERHDLVTHLARFTPPTIPVIEDAEAREGRRRLH